jgi:hypothetical protein
MQSTTESATELELIEEELRAKNAEIVREGMKIKKLKGNIASLTSPILIQAQIDAKIKEEVTNKLKLMITRCEALIDSMPIYSEKTRQDKKWKTSTQYGYGNQVELLIGLLSGIQYSDKTHKAHLLALTGLNEDLIESTLDGFGNPTYYSNIDGMVIEERPFNLDKILTNISLVEQALDIILDKDKLTGVNMRSRFQSARSAVNRTLTATTTTESVSDQLIDIAN